MRSEYGEVARDVMGHVEAGDMSIEVLPPSLFFTKVLMDPPEEELVKLVTLFV